MIFRAMRAAAASKKSKQFKEDKRKMHLQLR
jgi:hypothetical protein